MTVHAEAKAADTFIFQDSFPPVFYFVTKNGIFIGRMNEFYRNLDNI